jgi:transcriptional regulator with XRE-family HTH domain
MARGLFLDDAESKYNQALGRRLAAARRAAEMRQSDLAAKLGVSQQTLSALEKGRTRCAPLLLELVARELNVSLRYLLPKAQPPLTL